MDSGAEVPAGRGALFILQEIFVVILGCNFISGGGCKYEAGDKNGRHGVVSVNSVVIGKGATGFRERVRTHASFPKERDQIRSLIEARSTPDQA